MNTIQIPLRVLICLIVCCSTTQAAEQLYRSQPTVTPALALSGEYTVGVKTLNLVNPAQIDSSDLSKRKDRTLTVELWYPANSSSKNEVAIYNDVLRSKTPISLQGTALRNAKPIANKTPFPIVVLSHGYTGYRTIMFYLGEHLASHGYVVAAIDHTGSLNAEIDFSKVPFSGLVSTFIHRPLDQQFVLEALNRKESGLASLVDNDSAAVIGYSMGGYGALNTVGGCYEHSESRLLGFNIPKHAIPAAQGAMNYCQAAMQTVDPRWKAMVAFAPWGGEQDIHTADSLATIKVPGLFVAGEQDDVSGYRNGVQKLFNHYGAKHKYMLVYENARHNIAPHPAPKAAYGNALDMGHYFEGSWKMETINRINQHMVLAFLNCHVKTDANACNFLPKREQVTQTRQADRKLNDPWPGFASRFSTGLRFYRSPETRIDGE